MINKVLSYISDFSSLKKSDILLVSYPKTGNTWVRFFFMNLFNESEKKFDQIGFKELDTHFLEIGHGNLKRPFIFEGFPRIIKTHLKRKFPLTSKSNKVIYVIRDPRDTMVSFYHYKMNKDLISEKMTFSEFIRSDVHGLSAYFDHYYSWKSQISFLAKYEDLKNEPEATFHKLSNTFFQGRVLDQQIDTAIVKSNFKSIKKSEKEQGHSKEVYGRKGTSFTRDGSLRQWVKYFNEEDEAYYSSIKNEFGFDLY